MAQPIRSTREMVQTLTEEVRRIEGARRASGAGVISSGSPGLDRLLPEGGFRPGSLVEWLGDDAGGGAGTLALLAARQAIGQRGTLVVVDRESLFYPPAAARLGIDLARLFVVRCQSDEDHAWALDQVLRCAGVAAAWSFAGQQDDHAWRRWQLAAESSGVLGLLLRSAAARREPCWAELRLLVEPIAGSGGRSMRNRRLRVELLRSRTARAGGAIELEISGRGALVAPRPAEPGANHETRAVHLASPVAAAKARRRSRRA